MSLSTKILIWLGVILGLGMLSFIVYKEVEISKRQQAIETQVVLQKNLVDGIVRSQNQYATKDDVEKFIKDNGVNVKAIQDDLDKLHADITAVNIAVVNSKGQTGNNIPTTNTGPSNPDPIPVSICKDGTPCPNADPFGYLRVQQNLSLTEDFGSVRVPFGSAGFSAWQPHPWSIDIKPREYHVTSVIGTDEEQRIYFYNKFTLKVDGHSYDLPITTAETKQEYPEAKFSYWNPRFYIGADAGVGLSPLKSEFTPNFNLSIMSYGKYKTFPDFSIIEFGLGYGLSSQKTQLIFTPVSYNIGQYFPFMHNVYAGPSIHLGIDGNVGVMFGIRVGL